MGEKRVRRVEMADGVTIKDDKNQKDQVLVEGVCILLVECLANILERH